MAPKDRLAKHLQSVVEWKYERAHRYWDDCGKLISAIESAFPGLRCQGLEPDGFGFVGKSGGLTAAKFYWDKATITQVNLGDTGLPDAAAKFWPLVREVLQIGATTFLGHRTWMVYETDSVKDAVRSIDSLRLWQLLTPNAQGFGAPLAGGSVLRTQLEPGGRRLRLSVDAGTMAVDGKAHHGLIGDVDFVLQEPARVPVEPEAIKEFIEWNLQFMRESVQPLFRVRK